MSWSVQFNGHAESKAAEREVIRAFRSALHELNRDGKTGVSSGRMVSSHHGNFDLLTMTRDDEGTVSVEEDEDLEVKEEKSTAKKTLPSLKDAQKK